MLLYSDRMESFRFINNSTSFKRIPGTPFRVTARQFAPTIGKSYMLTEDTFDTAVYESTTNHHISSVAMQSLFNYEDDEDEKV